MSRSAFILAECPILFHGQYQKLLLLLQRTKVSYTKFCLKIGSSGSKKMLLDPLTILELLVSVKNSPFSQVSNSVIERKLLNFSCCYSYFIYIHIHSYVWTKLVFLHILNPVHKSWIHVPILCCLTGITM